ncbi:protein stoned-B [Episyrphus balteatus]|uniref:protein stoned-B n=1 Tax=Episyrphus balteatus TaxID=286459 RepID=UPI002486A9C6|nr:protein stoned-B [Episyrphus balteatus]
MANPFLMMGDDMDDGADAAVNPFLMQAGPEEPAGEDFDNPFAGQTNPFAFGDDAEEELPPTTVATTMADIFQAQPTAAKTTNASAFQSIDPAMSFFGTTIEADDDAMDPSSEESGKKGPPPRPSPPSQQTQDLIYSVSDQLDQASSQLLGRLPATRSPSPVSMRDLHSPSPTPDSGLADLLDVSDSGSSATQGFDMDLMGSSNENPFAAPTSIPTVQAATPMPQQTKALPPRPPPPRPAPPRPTPPSIPGAPPRPVPPQPNQQQQAKEPDDLFDMFGTTAPAKPPPPKSKEDILSLFSKPSPPQPAQQDLLSGDIVLDPMPEGEQQKTEEAAVTTPPGGAAEAEPSPLIETEEPVEEGKEDPIFSSTLTHPDESSQDITSHPQAAVEEEKLAIAPEIPKMRAPTPDIEITTVEDLPRSDDEEEPEPVPVPPPEIIETHADPEPLESEPEEVAEVEKTEADHSPPTESIVTTQAVPESPIDANSSYQASEPEQMDTGLDFAPPSGTASANPFASPDADEETYPQPTVVTNIFAVEEPAVTNIFAVDPEPAVNIFAADPDPVPVVATNIFAASDEFDAFSAKFDSVKKDNVSLLDGFGGGITPTSTGGGDAWGDTDDFGAVTPAAPDDGFGVEDGFDPFLAMQAPERSDSVESVDKEFSVVIRPKAENAQGVTPALAPPPPPRGSQNNSVYSGDTSPRVNPFDKGEEDAGFPAPAVAADQTVPPMQRTDSQETPQTPLFDEDVSQPLEDFPRLNYVGPGWEMQLRQPNKKKITGQRFWKKIFVKMAIQNDVPVIQLFNQASDKQPFQELPLQPSYSVSEVGAQQYDQFGKIFTMKLQYIFYKERPGVRPGQVTKAGRITDKLSQFAQYAIAGDYQGVKEFGSDLKKLGLPVEHAPQSSQLFKIGSMNYEDMKQLSVCIEEALFKISAHRDRALNYKMEEVQVTAVDEIYVEQDSEGKILKQIARVRLFFLAFLSGMPTIELGMNDMWRQGKEVVGRHDIIPVVTEEWIRLEKVEFHNSVNLEEYERTRTIKFQPPDACYIELFRFRVRPPKNRELPLQLKATWCVTGNKVELRADILVPGFASRKLGQIPCEDVSIRFPIPECWIYLFRVEKHFRYGSVKSAHRRTGKIKGIERILGTVDTLQESLIEVTSGQAKYEHHHRAIVWRCPRLPKEGQGAYTTHQMVCRMALTSYDQIPSELAPFALVEFTMPATQVSHTTVRSVSVQDSDSDEPPEKYVRYLARHEYKVGIETTHGESQNAYLAATRPTSIKEAPASPQPAASPMPPSDSDSDSN